MTMNPLIVPIIAWAAKTLIEAAVAQGIEELRFRSVQRMSSRDKVILQKRLDYHLDKEVSSKES